MIFRSRKIIILLLGIIVMTSFRLVKAEENKKIFYLNERGTTSGVIFSKEDLMWPGKKMAKEFYIVNDNKFKCYLKNLSVDGKLEKRNGTNLDSSTVEYASFLDNLHVKFYLDDKEIFAGDGRQFLNLNMINNNLVFNESDRKKFNLEIEFGENTDNSTMDLNYIFDINTNYYNENISELGENITGSLVKTGSFIDIKVLVFTGILLCIIGAGNLIISKASKKQ